MKKAALGLALALTMSTAIACAPADDGAIGDTTYRGADQRGTQQFGARGVGNQRGGVILGGTGNQRQGMYNERGTVGANRGGIVGRDRAGVPGGTVIRDDGMLARDDDNRTGGLFGRVGRDGGLFGGDTARRGGGLLYGGAGTRMEGARGGQGAGIDGQRMGTQDRDSDLESRILGIPGVSDAIVVQYGNDIIVGVETEGRNNNVVQQIRQEIQEKARGQQVHINILNDNNNEGQNRTTQQNNK